MNLYAIIYILRRYYFKRLFIIELNITSNIEVSYSFEKNTIAEKIFDVCCLNWIYWHQVQHRFDSIKRVFDCFDEWSSAPLVTENLFEVFEMKSLKTNEHYFVKIDLDTTIRCNSSESTREWNWLLHIESKFQKTFFYNIFT